MISTSAGSSDSTDRGADRCRGCLFAASLFGLGDESEVGKVGEAAKDRCYNSVGRDPSKTG